MKLLDLFSCQGIGSTGYHRAGWEMTGVDIDPTHGRYYPYEFIHADALQYLIDHGHEYDAIHASPPCQAMTRGNAGRVTNHVNLIPQTRMALVATGRPFVIENVEHAKRHLIDPVTLCGSMFGLTTQDEDGWPLWLPRHRLFETNWGLAAPPHPAHNTVPGWVAGVYNGGRARKAGATAAEHRHDCRYVRKGGYVPRDHDVKRRLLGVDFPTTVKALTECIPPAYTEFIGHQLAAHVKENAA
ncbi:hypothetical protein ACI3EY_16780 [Ornithinimicrobium sp. LYQ92]|uniref:hypothetical protein n=1 Tax=Serinicoccus sp. LYQ92 TaxID=3378798 RepID=UPI0038544C08